MTLAWLTLRRLCKCGHDRYAHKHYRRGGDCSLCDGRDGRYCPRWH